MEWSADGRQLTGRLLLCGGAAAVLLGAAKKFPALEDYRPWLEAHRLEAGAVLAGALLGLSLLVFPLPEAGEEEEAQDPCGGYSPVE